MKADDINEAAAAQAAPHNAAPAEQSAGPPPAAVPLPVLVSSNKADALRRQLEADRESEAEAGPLPPPGDPGSNPPAAAEATPSQAIQRKLLQGKVIEVIRQIYDPEIPVNIYDLGLIYEINVLDDNAVKVKMTLTAPACPVAGTLPGEVEKRIENIDEVKSADVELVWDPPWSRDSMSEAAQLQLGLF